MKDYVDPRLNFLAKTVDEIEMMRKTTENRLRVFTRDEPDSDGQVRGLGWVEDDPRLDSLQRTLDSIQEAEKRAVSELEKHMRTSAFGPFLEESVGIAAKGLGRLLGATGDPYVHPAQYNDGELVEPERPRKVSELWSYCGWVPFRKRQKGQLANWSVEGKMRSFIIAEAAIKLTGEPDKNGKTRARSPYRDVYDRRKAHTEGRVHSVECPPCGPKGSPAQPGDPWSDKHRHIDAVRIVAKELLKDLWLESRDLHEEE